MHAKTGFRADGLVPQLRRTLLLAVALTLHLPRATCALASQPLAVPVIVGPSTLCPTGNAVLEASAGYDSYGWYKDGSAIGGANSRTYTALAPGTYRLVVSSNGFSATSIEKIITSSCAAVPEVYWLHVDDTGSGNGNGNRMVEPGETFDLDVSLFNSGWTGLTGVTATLLPADAGVVVHQGSSAYPDLAGSAVEHNAQPFTVTAGCGAAVNLTLSVSSAEGTFDVPVTLAIPQPGEDWRSSGPLGDDAGVILANRLMVYDSRRGKLMRFVQRGRWDWDGARWRRLDSTTPPWLYAAAYDPVRDVVVALSEVFNFGSVSSETWEYAPGTNSWTLRNDVPRVATVNGAVAAYDPKRGVIVAFGGNGMTSANPTFEYDGTSWRLVATEHSPPARGLTSIAYDVGRGVIVIAGGTTMSGDLADVWEFDGIDWRQAASLPAVARGVGLTYSPLHGGLVAAFGVGRTGSLSSTVVYTGSAWISTGQAGPSPGLTSLTFDEQRRRLVAITNLADVFENDGTAWSGRTFERPDASVALAVYDDVRKATVVLPGSNAASFRGTALWDGGSWRLLSGSRSAAVSMAWASFLGKTVAVDAQGNTFVFDGTVWSQVITAAKPLPAGSSVLYDFTLATDSVRKRVVLFGGYKFVGGLGVYVGDTWEFDGTNWAMRTPTTSPPPRASTAMAFDARRNVTVLYGGGSSTTGGASVTYGDVWEWDGADWVQRTFASPAPPGTSGHKLVYDPAAQAVLLWGVAPGRGWLWNGSAWSEAIATPHLPYYFGMALAYDSTRNTLVATNGASTFERAAPVFCSLAPHEDISVASEAGSCGSHVTYTIGSIGPCAITATPASGSMFPVGLTRVVATSSCGERISFNVTVRPSAACPVTFTDDPIVPGQTVVKAVHILELRNYVDALRAQAQLAPGSYSPLGAGTMIRVQHVTELRTLLDEARQAVGRAALVYQRPTLLPSMTVMAIDITELRNGLR